MPQYVRPRVFLIGAQAILDEGLEEYLRFVKCEDFLASIDKARELGLSDGEILVSTYAKLCYRSLTLGQNDNITRTRDIADNLKSCYDTGHGSVFEHCSLNFIVTNCSRVFTHEQVRHRVGVAYSQTSGRYVRSLPISFVEDDVIGDEALQLGRELLQTIERYYADMQKASGVEDMRDFTRKKQITSALRRYLPNGQANEIGMTLNVRSLRHLLQIRTSEHAEREIRDIYGQVHDIIAEKYPGMVADAKVKIVDGMKVVYGMRMQPYDTILPE